MGCTLELLLARGDSSVIENLPRGSVSIAKNMVTIVEAVLQIKPWWKRPWEFSPEALVHTAASYKDPDDWYNDTLTNCVGGQLFVVVGSRR